MSEKGQDFFRGRSVLVLGAGYVGGAVAVRARELGAQVSALTRNPGRCTWLETSGVRTLQADLASDSWHELAGRADFVLVSVGSGGGGTPDAYRHSYVQGMQSVLRWASERFVDTLVYTSSTSVYPQGGGILLTEDQPISPVGEDPTGLLVQAESLLHTPVAGVHRSFVLRLAGIYGPERHGFIDRLRDAPLQLSGDGSSHLNLIHRDDIVSAVLGCWSAPTTLPGGIFNLADEGRATRAEIASWLASRVGVSEVAFTGTPAAGRRRATPDRIISADRIRQQLGWRPAYASFREGYASLLHEQ